MCAAGNTHTHTRVLFLHFCFPSYSPCLFCSVFHCLTVTSPPSVERRTLPCRLLPRWTSSFGATTSSLHAALQCQAIQNRGPSHKWRWTTGEVEVNAAFGRRWGWGFRAHECSYVRMYVCAFWRLMLVREMKFRA